MTQAAEDDALAWLYSRSRAGGERTSARAAALLAALGLAPPPLTAVVVGTNGKGTVTAMMAAGLSAAGRVTGRFLSPHVEAFEERVAVAGNPTTRGRVAEFVRAARDLDAAWPHGEATRPAFFEWVLAFALDEFNRLGADAAVLEAGVGGHHDATRAVAPLALAVLTNVDLDHVETLGGSLEAIARDKALAFRPGVPAVCGATQPGVLAVVGSVAAELGAPLHVDPFAAGGGGEAALFTLPRAVERALGEPGTAGGLRRANRRANSRLAAAALRLLGVDEAGVAAGLTAPALPARLERFLLPPAAVGSRPVLVVLDGAHDPAAADRLAGEVEPGYVLLFGALARKQGREVLERLAPRAAGVVVTDAATGEPAAHARAGDVYLSDTSAALGAALALAEATPTNQPTVVVAGSLYLAGLVRPLLRAAGTRLMDPWEGPAPRPAAGLSARSRRATYGG